MQMIHVFLTARTPPCLSPPDAGRFAPAAPALADIPAMVTSCARQDDALQHVAAHRQDTDFALTLFVSSDRLADAERAAMAICRRAVALCPALGQYSIRSAEAGFVAAYYE
ncbi:hypothetical protein [Kitasatospora sp. NPDC085879]|uniref:hypothetical protein n=1 Tax=Kitasatospora sp. NPDC085879 TaxID=3154769 RepID=UPI00341BF03A